MPGEPRTWAALPPLALAAGSWVVLILIVALFFVIVYGYLTRGS
jgi:hypothetical protein